MYHIEQHLDCHLVRVLLRKEFTEFYLQDSGDWGPSRETATTFIDSVAAFGWVQDHGLSKIQIVLACPAWQSDIMLQ